jgi:hypothetical protein
VAAATIEGLDEELAALSARPAPPSRGLGCPRYSAHYAAAIRIQRARGAGRGVQARQREREQQSVACVREGQARKLRGEVRQLEEQVGPPTARAGLQLLTLR